LVHEADFSFGTEKLELRPDGVYAQVLTIRGENTGVLHSGMWEYRESDNHLELHDPLQFDDYFGRLNPDYKSPVTGIWGLNAERTFGGIVLTWAPDFDFKFSKLME
jgi:hypothetical protein